MDPSELAIDIHTNKLLDWLISRNHVTREWSDRLLTIREKMKAAIQDMPEHKEIAKLLSGAQLNYYNCVKIVEILKETESGTKNFFGSYSSQRMKDWQEIVKLYEADSVHLAESAQALIRNVNYEVPSRKKAELKCEASKEEATRKIGDFQRQSQNHKNDYSSECTKLGIRGQDPRRELTELLSELPVLCEVITSKARLTSMVEAVDYYRAFIGFTSTSRRSADDLLAMLRYIQDKGNTTYYEYRTGEIPEVIEELKSVQIHQANDANGNSEDGIDFGDGDLGDNIDFGEETGSESVNGAFVKVTVSGGGTPADAAAEPTDINWDLDVDVSSPGEGTTTTHSGSDGSSNRVARGFDAFRVLEFHETRNDLFNNILELEGFLDQRIIDMTTSERETATTSITGAMDGAPSEVERQTPDSLRDMLSSVTDLLSLVTSQKMKNLFLMRDNPKYVDKVLKNLNVKLDLAERCLQKARVTEEKIHQLDAEETQVAREIPQIISETKKLQKLIEAEVAKRYKGRPVNIMGGVQVL